MKLNINTEFEIKSLEDLKKLKLLLEANNLSKPNYSQLSRELGYDRRTIKKYYELKEGDLSRKKKKSKIDEYYEIIEKLLSPISENEGQKFYYKAHLYRYLEREHGLDCKLNTFNHYILRHREFAEYFKGNKKIHAVKSEVPFGEQGQFDWKERINFTFIDGTTISINVGVLVLSASRFKVWKVYPSTIQNYLFDFLSKAFETIGGVPKKVYVDNAKTMMDVARTEKFKGKVNAKFQQLADDYGFKIEPCIAGRPNTKAKVESPMKLIDEIMTYNGKLKDFKELEEKLEILNNEANSRISQATGYAPTLVFNKEKEHLLDLPSKKVCSSYQNTTSIVKVNNNSLFNYRGNQYSVAPEYIGKYVHLLITDKDLHVYYSKKMIALHQISEKKVNYQETHHLEILKQTFPEKENIEEQALNHLKELEKFNEQISAIKR